MRRSTLRSLVAVSSDARISFICPSGNNDRLSPRYLSVKCILFHFYFQLYYAYVSLKSPLLDLYATKPGGGLNSWNGSNDADILCEGR